MQTHIFTTVSSSFEMSIPILQQQILAPLAQQCMDVICEYAK